MAEVCELQTGMDGLDITWAHAVNSQDKLNKAFESGCCMLEADVLLNKSGVPIMAHPPARDSDITLDTWMEKTLKTDKGIKLDFKETAALEPSFQVLENYKEKLLTDHRPLWLNADVLKGPNTQGEPVNAAKFISTCKDNFPAATLSVGWQCKWDVNQHKPFSWQMIFEMLKYVDQLPQEVTFAVGAGWLKSSLEQFLWLLGIKETFSLTIWSHPHHQVDMQTLVDLRCHVDKSRLFYDLPETHMQEFRQAIESTAPSGVHFPQKSRNFDKALWEEFISEKREGHIYFSSEGVAFTGESFACFLQTKDESCQTFTLCGEGKFLSSEQESSESSNMIIQICSSGLRNMQLQDGVRVSISNHGNCRLSDHSSSDISDSMLLDGKFLFKIKCDISNSFVHLDVDFDKCDGLNSHAKVSLSLSNPTVTGQFVTVCKTGSADLLLYDLYFTYT